MMKKVLLFLLGAGLVLSNVSPADVIVILNDTFADGDRTNTDLPTDSAVWFSHKDYLTVSPGSLAVDQVGIGGSSKMWTYFAPNDSPVSLEVGHQLIATIDFTPQVAMSGDNTSKNFRFGLFYDPTDPQVLADQNKDSGGDDNPWIDSTGYAVQFSLSTTDTAGAIAVGKRTSTTTTSLLGSAGAYSWGTSSGKATNLTLDTLYTMTLVLDYQTADLMVVTFTFSEGDNVIATNSLVDDGLGGKPVYTQFDQLFFRMSSNVGTADVLDYSRFMIEHVVPEPATMVLLGLGGLLTTLRRR